MIRLLFSLLVVACLGERNRGATARHAGRTGSEAGRFETAHRRHPRRPRSGGKSAYELGHIAGAQHAPYAKWRGPAESPGKLPAVDALTALIQQLGIDRTTPVVVVYEGKDSTDFGSAARVYWTLKAAGVSTLSVLNGGMTAWRAAGLPISTETSARAPSSFQITLDSRLIATRDEVAQVGGQSLSAAARHAAGRHISRAKTRHTRRQDARDDRRREERQSRRVVYKGRPVAAPR